MNIDAIYDCIICLERYNDSNRKPNVLYSCGHTICEVCLESITNNTCPTCRADIERTCINYALIPSNQPVRLSQSVQDDSLWASLKTYMISDVEEKQNILFKAKEEKTKEYSDIFSELKSKIQNEVDKNEKNNILIETERLMRKCDEKESEIKSKIENIFLKNEDKIETELKLIKNKVEKRRFELNEIENFKMRSDHLKNELDKKSNQIRNIKINIKLDDIMSQEIKSGIYIYIY